MTWASSAQPGGSPWDADPWQIDLEKDDKTPVFDVRALAGIRVLSRLVATGHTWGSAVLTVMGSVDGTQFYSLGTTISGEGLTSRIDVAAVGWVRVDVTTNQSGTAAVAAIIFGGDAFVTLDTTAIEWGTTAPTDTTKLWGHTTDQEIYRYDSTRGEWLGEWRHVEFNYNGSVAAGSGASMRIGISLHGDDGGRRLPYDITVVAAEAQHRTGSDNVTATFSLLAGGSSAATLTITADTSASDQGIDVDIAGGTNLAGRFDVDAGSANSIDSPVFTVWYRRRRT